MARINRRSRFERGISFVDALVGTLIAVIAIVGMLNLASALMNMTLRHQKMTVAYNIGRSAIEEVRNQGFPNYPEGVQAYYYDAHGAGGSNVPGKGTSYKVTVEVVSTGFMTGMGISRPAPTARRDVSLQVAEYPSGKELIGWGTILVRGGV